MPKLPFNAVVFDIEATDLAAVGAGVLLAAVIKPIGGKIKVFRLDDYKCRPGRETPLVRDILNELQQYDIWIGHNIDRYDINYLKSRAFRLGVNFAPIEPITYDTMRAFGRAGYLTRYNAFGKPSKGLAMVVDFFGEKQTKTSIMPREWWEAIWGNTDERKEALDKIVDHCIEDVKMNTAIIPYLLQSDRRLKIGRKV